MTFGPSCGAERKEGSKFCHNCGYDFNKFDSAKGNSNSNLNNSNLSNPNLNNSTSTSTVSSNPNVEVPENKNSHGVAKVLGYIFAVLIPIIGIIIGIYLLMSENQDVHKHGKYIIFIGAVIQLISFLSVMAH